MHYLNKYLTYIINFSVHVQTFAPFHKENCHSIAS